MFLVVLVPLKPKLVYIKEGQFQETCFGLDTY